MRFKQLYLLCTLLLTCFCFELHAQGNDTLAKPKILNPDRPGFMDRIQAFAKAESQESIDDFAADKAAIAQYKLLEQIKAGMQKAKLYLRNGIDTNGTKADLELIHRDMVIAGDGVFTNKGSAQTFRNLSATTKILTELYSKASIRKIRLENYNDALNKFHFQLDSLSADPAFFKFPKDSAASAKYLQQLVVVAREVKPVNDSLKKVSNSIQLLLNELSLTTLSLQNSIDEIADYQREMANNTFKREFGNIWEAVGYTREFNTIIDYSLKKDLLTLIFYLQDNKGKTTVMLLLIAVAFIYLRSLKGIYLENGLLDVDFKDQVVLRYPLLSAVVIVINLFQFAFIAPPFLWSMILWTTSAACLSLLFKSFITRYWLITWLTMVLLFLLAATDNLILQASRTERWLMLLLSVTGAVTGGIVYFTGNRKSLREQWIVYAIGLMSALQILSTFANVFGRYNLAKSLLMSGFLNVLVAIMFLWTVRLINEGLTLAFNVYRQPDKKLFYLNYNKLGSKAPAYFYVLLVIGWVTLVGRNFSAFEYLAVPVSRFFSSEHTLGQYSFSINSILLFVVIIGSSVIVSKIVSFFASDQHLHHTDEKGGQTNTRGLGSWLLLIRIAILSIGLFLAIAAVGIPIDRIAIVLGALGVGIGFGLQTLVNNLVSGLIIAFEKPVNVGDRVDVDGQSGTMKSIGFRSSIISTWDGADVVMPNGDLLNSHLTNWSLAGNKKRMFIAVGIAYDADLNKAKTIVQNLMEIEERLAKNPKHVIQFEQFGDSAIELRIYFWTKHISESAAVKSDLIMAINDSFAKNQISIPFPQRDIHLIGSDINKAPLKD